MYIFVTILGVIGAVSFHGAAELNGENVSSSQTSEIKEELLLNTEETFQDNIEYQNLPANDTYRSPLNRRCPLCDSSVYPYCGEKLLHDACCCTDFYVQDLPHQCKLADCRFLHANTCREHRLIAICCCNDDYRSLLKSLSFKNNNSN